MISKLKAHTLLFILSFVLLILSFLLEADRLKLVMNLHDTYYVISYSDCLLLFSIITVFNGSLYWVFSKLKITLRPSFKKRHSSIFTALVIILFTGLLIFSYLISHNNSIFNEYDSGRLIFIVFILLIFALLQIVFLFFMIDTLIKHGIQRRNSK